MRVWLNGSVYELKAGTTVRRQPMPEWSENIRLDGVQKRKDRSGVSSWTFGNHSAGLGIQQMQVDISSEVNALWDAENCDTRLPTQIVLSPQLQTPAITPSRGDLDYLIEWNDNLYFVQSGGITNAGVAFQYTPASGLASYANITSTITLPNSNDRRVGSISGIHIFGDNITFFGDVTTARNTLLRVSSMNGALLDGSYRVGTLWVNTPQFADLGGTIHIIGNDGATIRFLVGDQSGGSISIVGTAPSLVGTYLAPLISDGINMYANLPQGIYNFDATPAIVVSTERSQDKNNVQDLFENYIYFKNKTSVMRYDGTDVLAKGYDTRDGLPSDKMGQVTAMASSWKYLFAAVQGLTYSHILAYDKTAWQYYARIPSPGLWVKKLYLSDVPDGVDKLWVLYGNHSVPGYFLNPMVNPLQAGTYDYVPTGHFTKPIFDGGMPEKNSAFYSWAVNADAMGGSNNINLFYGLDGATPTLNLGLIATTSGFHLFGSPYGVTGNRIQLRWHLSRSPSAAGTTPVFRESPLEYLKIPETRESFSFSIDLDETANRTRRTVEAVIGSLNYERDLVTLMPFYYGQIATTAVKILPIASDEEVDEQNMLEGERAGFVNVTVGEII